MTRDDWKRAEPILTEALLLPEAEQRGLLETVDLDEALRRDILMLLRRSMIGSASVAVAGQPSMSSSSPQSPLPSPPPPLPPLAPGSTLATGRYVVVRQIGRGGMGAVYLGHDTTFGTLVALKIMPYDERLLAEARRAAVCSDHPHVATIHNVLQEQVGGQDLGVLVMEYVAGTPASHLLDDGPVDVGRVLKWGRQIAAAIAHAHEHQVLHCDLKPANIAITSDGRAKVLDFGISRATFEADDSKLPVRGTMPYMAPEQLVSKQFLPAGDVYSLGVTLFELLTGRRPFEGDDDMLQLRIVAAPPPDARDLVADVPPELEKVLARAMEKDPARRFRSARSFERALEAVEAGVQYTSGLVPVPPRAVPPPLSLWTKIGLGFIGTLSIVAAVGLLGAYTSAVYNQVLERAGFASDSLWDWLNYGLRASGGPFAFLVITTLAWMVVRFVGRLTVHLLDPRQRLRLRLSGFYRHVSGRLDLSDAAARSVAALLVSASALAIATFLYRDLFPAFVAFAATSPPERLALLAPEHVGEHNAFRRSFSFVVIVSIALWYPLLTNAQRRRAVPRGVLTAGVVTLVVALVFLHHPHRMMFSELAGHGVEVVRWQDHECYVLGQRGSDTLLLCPARSPRRHAIVRTGDPAVVPTGVRESPFRGFYRLVE